jgi:hypothetical protein
MPMSYTLHYFVSTSHVSGDGHFDLPILIDCCCTAGPLLSPRFAANAQMYYLAITRVPMLSIK